MNIVEVSVTQLGLDQNSKQPVVILQEREGSRVLPIWIGPAEASAIAMELAGMKFSRPLTHDLLRQVIVGLGAALDQVLITKMEDRTYYAELHLRRDDHVVHVDARPSDSIAVALRLQAPIFIDENLFDPAAEMEQPDQELDADQLKDYLKDLDPEDFGKFTP